MTFTADLFRPLGIFVALILLFDLCGCRTSTIGVNQGKRAEVNGTIVSLARAENGSFRYYGKFLLQTPSRYRGKEVGFFVISHDRDVREFVGKAIAVNFDDGDLTRSIESVPDPFSFGQNELQLSMEFANDVFSTIDYMGYEKPVPVRGVVRTYQPDKDNGSLYFQFDMGYSGDLASIEIIEPAKYRGLIVHIVVGDVSRCDSGHRSKWNRIGATLGFSTPESTLAWEPWGFTPIEQLGPVDFTAN